MTLHKNLSLFDAVMININVMFGTGVLINTVNLALYAGFLGFVSYLFVAALMIPLILSIAQALKQYPSGGFYAYAAIDIHPVAGFLSSWAYFVGKLASATLLIHIFSSTIQVVIPTLASIPLISIDLFVLSIFTWLNMYNMKTGTRITYFFILAKFVPIIFAIISCLSLFNQWAIPSDAFAWQGLPATIPLVLYAFVGFEVACSISNSIENAERNAPKAVIYSFGIVVLITTLYQLVIFLALGNQLTYLSNFLGIFKLILTQLLDSSNLAYHFLLKIFYIAGASSALGGSYGILFSNSWNLYTLANENHLPFAAHITQLNKYQVPFICVLIEALLCTGYFILTYGHQVTLQQISVLGCTIAYGFTVAGLILNKNTQHRLMACGALISCILLAASAVRNFYQSGWCYLATFIGLLITGLILFGLSKITKEK